MNFFRQGGLLHEFKRSCLLRIRAGGITMAPKSLIVFTLRKEKWPWPLLES